MFLHEDPNKLITGHITLAPEVLPEENYRKSIFHPELWLDSEADETVSHLFGKSYSLEPYFARDILEQNVHL